MAFASVPTEDFRRTNGVTRVRAIRSSSFGQREFCDQCGMPLRVRVDHQPETVDFPIVTLDEPDSIHGVPHLLGKQGRLV